MPAEQLGKLLTDLGERSLYDAVSQCSRCGFCEQACPTYVTTGDEAHSARGRNQIVRMLLEGRFADPSQASAALSTCLLCSACTTVCPAHVPTADIVLEGRRLIREATPWPARVLAWLLARPQVLVPILKTAYALKRWGVSRLASKSGVLRLLGLRGLEEAEAHVDEAPKKLLGEILKKDSELNDLSGTSWLYFAPCGPNYVLPKVGLATVKVLKAKRGKGAYLDNGCCGLLSYNYGDLGRARSLAQANIERLETAPTGDLVGDCSSCVAHLKIYPQLFLDDPSWKKRAEAFSARVRDVMEVISADKPSCKGPATWHDSCRAKNGMGIISQPRAAMKTLAPEYRELPDAGVCCGGAGAFAFLQPELSEDLLKAKIAHIASTGAAVVASSSTSCLLQLARGLRKYYPEGRVVHYSELLAESLDG